MEPFIGMIIMFGGNFAPRGWALCNGQLLDIASHSALFSVLGTTYGGDGVRTFGLPDLRGRLAMHHGSGPGLSSRALGQKGGEESVTLTTAQMPAHAHGLHAYSGAPDVSTPAGHNLAGADIYSERPVDSTLVAASIDQTGGGQSHDNMPPYLCINFIIALLGTYPSRD